MANDDAINMVTGTIDTVNIHTTNKDIIKKYEDQINRRIVMRRIRNGSVSQKDIDEIIHEVTGISNDSEKPVNDPVNHPSHYTRGKYEVIDFIESWGLDGCFQLATAVKYICRAGYKDPTKYVEDLEKAVWYINRVVEKLYEGGFELTYGLDWDIDTPPIEVIDFIRDQGLDRSFGLSFALFYICYAPMNYTRLFLEYAVAQIKEEIMRYEKERSNG